MEIKDLVKVYACAEILWRTFKPETNGIKAQLQDEVWFDYLKDFDLDLIFTAMREQAKVSDFCNIAKVALRCEDVLNDMPDESDILAEIDRAIDYYSAEEKFQKLSTIAKSVVGTPAQLAQWAMADIKDFSTVIESNIRKAIRARLEATNKKKSYQAYLENKKQAEIENQNKFLLGD